MTYVDSSLEPTGYLLALAGSEERLQIVLGKPKQDGFSLLASREWTVPGESIQFLTPGLKTMLDEFDLTMQHITHIACVRGPGSFTGLRLVIAAAEGLAAGCGAQLAGIDYLPLLAQSAASVFHGLIHILTYARRGLVYMQSFNAPSLREAHPLQSVTLDEAASIIVRTSDTAILLGSALRKNEKYFMNFIEEHPDYTLLPAYWDNPSPAVLLETAQKAHFSDSPIVPIYVRASDAEDNLPQIAKKRGLDPIKAQKKLQELQKI